MSQKSRFVLFNSSLGLAAWKCFNCDLNQLICWWRKDLTVSVVEYSCHWIDLSLRLSMDFCPPVAKADVFLVEHNKYCLFCFIFSQPVLWIFLEIEILIHYEDSEIVLDAKMLFQFNVTADFAQHFEFFVFIWLCRSLHYSVLMFWSNVYTLNSDS